MSSSLVISKLRASLPHPLSELNRGAGVQQPIGTIVDINNKTARGISELRVSIGVGQILERGVGGVLHSLTERISGEIKRSFVVLDRESNGVVDGVDEGGSVSNRSTGVEHLCQFIPVGGVRSHVSSSLHGRLRVLPAFLRVLSQRIRHNLVIFEEINLSFNRSRTTNTSDKEMGVSHSQPGSHGTGIAAPEDNPRLSSVHAINIDNVVEINTEISKIFQSLHGRQPLHVMGLQVVNGAGFSRTVVSVLQLNNKSTELRGKSNSQTTINISDVRGSFLSQLEENRSTGFVVSIIVEVSLLKEGGVKSIKVILLLFVHALHKVIVIMFEHMFSLMATKSVSKPPQKMSSRGTTLPNHHQPQSNHTQKH
mmetsp:Transcript_7921/g.11964  ORF Transcript_7921/g.11964 Transcript_7921/m.11964 type:complete len:367 (+) Transcript_7921:499-1599(+)